MINYIQIENQEIAREEIFFLDYQFRKLEDTTGTGIITIIFRDSNTKIINVPEVTEDDFDNYCKNINEQLQNV